MHSSRAAAAASVLALLLAAAVSVASGSGRSTDEAAARQWYDGYNRQLEQEMNALVEAAWRYSLNISEENSDRMAAAQLAFAAFRRTKSNEMHRRFDWTNFSDRLKRLFDYSADIGISIANRTMQQRLSTLQTSLETLYSTAKIKELGSDQELALDPHITRLLADPEVSERRKLRLWVAWREASGRLMKQNYSDFVDTLNVMIREAGYRDMMEYWQRLYKSKRSRNFEEMMESLWREVLPLYEQLHAYVRRRLQRRHGSSIFPPTGHIPAHVLGNMWSQSWENTLSDTLPFPHARQADISEGMQRQNWTALRMFKVSEEFFTSIGLKRMTDTFWKKSVMERLPGVEMVCHASAWDFYTGSGDFRIKQCTDITSEYLAITHHEMGHIQYFQQYEHQPVEFRRGGNPGFHEAIGDVMELSVMTPEHLKKIGLLNKTDSSQSYYINYLFQMALKKVAFLPFGYLIDRWRWRVFDKTIDADEFNEFWWRLRCQLQGVASPVKRTVDDFDPGAKFHVPFNVPYIRYFISHILQFQFYEALCNAAKHTGPLYKCDFYRNVDAGKLMQKMMTDGSSRDWEDVLFDMVGTRQMSAKPMLRYFSDLRTFLEEENKRNNSTVGWEANCPSDEWYDRVHQD